MKTAAIISVGTEIMRGYIDDTNSSFIANWLFGNGIEVKLRLSVNDEIKNIIRALELAQDADIVILTGGLGPTEDDCTREALSQYLGKNLIFHPEIWEKIVAYFQRFDKNVPESNKKQAMLFEGAEFIENKLGTAPGIYSRTNNKIYTLLPGPPNENQPMLKKFLFEKLKQLGFIDGNIYTRIIRLYNIGESRVADLFSTIETACEIGFYFSQNGYIDIHLTRAGLGRQENEIAVENLLQTVTGILTEQQIYYTDNIELSALLIDNLKGKKKTIAFAESITGGGLSAALVKTPDASLVLEGSVVAYSNKVKVNLLNVQPETLIKNGAVSEETVKEMSMGLKKLLNADISVAISGIAGPGGGSLDKPVGLVYIAFLFGDELIVKKEQFSGNRNRILIRCINAVYIEILKYLSLQKE